MLTDTKSFTTEEIDYIHHGDRALKRRLYKPVGAGPFPVVVDLHGGAWNNGDLNGCKGQDEVMADTGLAVAALDFRQAADRYPNSSVDINYAIRWLKVHAGDLGLDAERVGISGQSSGGHLAMLAGMRPNDARYASIAVEGGGSVDASVRCVGMLWPVMNPLARYRHALRSRDETPPAEWVGDIPESHDRYWVTDENMTEGNPTMALESGEAVETPPATWIQSLPDPVHNFTDPESGLGLTEPERFAHAYREAGGDIEVTYIEKADRTTRGAYDPLAAFFKKHLA